MALPLFGYLQRIFKNSNLSKPVISPMRSGQMNNAGRGMWSLEDGYILPKEWRRLHKK